MTDLQNMSFGDALDTHHVLDAYDDAEYLAREKAKEQRK